MANSRPYNITTKEVVGQTIVAEDHVTIQLDLPSILPREQTSSLLARELRGRKFEDTDKGTLVRERNGVKIEVDPSNNSMDVSSEASDTIPPPDNPSPCSCRAMEKLRITETLQSDLQKQVTERLTGTIGLLGCEMEGIIHRVTVEALKQKAAQMGEIKRVHEDGKTGDLTIVVEV